MGASKMKSLIFISLLLVGAFSSSIHEQLMRDLFDQWKQTHNKLYSTLYENEFRFRIFSKNYVDILAFNAQGESVTLGLNSFADMSQEEFSAIYTSGMPAGEVNDGKQIYFDNVQDLPASVDWRTKGAVTPVKNQGECGSCWAFSTTGALEGLYFLNNSQLLSFSEQNIVDCVKDCQQCGGGWPFYAYNYTAKNGIETETDYPYTGMNQNCTFDSSKAVHVNDGFYNVTPQNADQFKAALVGQPVSVCVGASGLAWQFYRGGVIKKFCNDGIDHCVLTVGYQMVDTDEAYIVKNSWGASWGNEGYLYISTDPTPNKGNGVCGILMFPTIPYKH